MNQRPGPTCAPNTTRVRRRLATLCGLCAAAVVAACGERAPTGAEFLVVTADSTFWVTADRGAVRARGVPMLVARLDGRFTELYVADDDRSFFNAVFVGHRLFARDLIRGDSLELHRDTLIQRLAVEYGKAHPDEQPLGPDDPENDDAPVRATSDLEILAVHGPYVSYEHHTDVDSRDDRSPDHRHQYVRGVVDARNGESRTLEQLFGRPVADSLIAAGRREWLAARDTLLAAAGSEAARTRAALAAFAFSPHSFSLGSDGQAPAVRFAVPASGVNPDIEPVELRPRTIAAPEWWAVVAPELPETAGADGRWVRGGDTLTVRADDGAAGWTVTLATDGARPQIALRASSAVDRVVWLDGSVTSDDRLALRRAFAEAGEYDGGRQVAATPLAPRATPIHLPRHGRNASAAHRTRVTARVVGPDDAAGREHPRSRVWRRDPGDAGQDRGRMRDATRAQAVRHRIG